MYDGPEYLTTMTFNDDNTCACQEFHKESKAYKVYSGYWAVIGEAFQGGWIQVEWVRWMEDHSYVKYKYTYSIRGRNELYYWGELYRRVR